MKIKQLIAVLQEMNPELEVTMETPTERSDEILVFEWPRLISGVGTFVNGHTGIQYAIIRHGGKIPRNNKTLKQ